MPQYQIANLICGSPNRNHDYDFARITLGQALYDAYGIKADCYQDYENTAAILGGDLLVTYTSQVPVSETACEALRRYLDRGGRWFAIHASNSVRGNTQLANLIGSRFITHPLYMKFPVKVAKPDDPLMEGIQDFEIEDELFCSEVVSDNVEVLLSSRWGGTGVMNVEVEEKDWPLLYRRRVGDGGILYMGLGHVNRPYDKPRMDGPDQEDHRGPWPTPIHKELVKRGIEWAAGRRPL